MVEIRFRSTRLEKAFAKLSDGAKLWGDTIARKYIERIKAIQALNHIDELPKAFPHYKAHELKGKRQGQWSIRLNDRWRMIYTIEDQGIAVNVEEVTAHYGD